MRNFLTFTGLLCLIVAGCSSGDKPPSAKAPPSVASAASPPFDSKKEGSTLAGSERQEPRTPSAELAPLPPPKSSNFVLGKTETEPPRVGPSDEPSSLVIPPPPPRDPPQNPPTVEVPSSPSPPFVETPLPPIPPPTQTSPANTNPLRLSSNTRPGTNLAPSIPAGGARSYSSNPFRTTLVADPTFDEPETFTTRSVFGSGGVNRPAPVAEEPSSPAAPPLPPPTLPVPAPVAPLSPPEPPTSLETITTETTSSGSPGTSSPPAATSPQDNTSFMPAVPSSQSQGTASSAGNSSTKPSYAFDLGSSLSPSSGGSGSSTTDGEDAVKENASKPNIPSNVERAESTLVKVFYATDRKLLSIEEEAKAARATWLYPAAAILVALMLMSGYLVVRGPQRVMYGAAFCGLGCLLMAGYVIQEKYPQLLPVPGSNIANQTIEYGSDRGDLHVGVCEVSIPKTHKSGELEAPSIWRLEFSEKEERHIVLERTVRQCEAEYYSQVKDRVNHSPRKDLFVFIHGYNVTFEDAARRTAQMAYDLRFEGAPIFYSWPSRGELLDYSVDENNVAWTVKNLKKFLLDLSKNSEAKSVNLIAHSMGNRALTAALKELTYEVQSTKAIYNEVILAAPDVDADIFKNDIAPFIAKSANRVTLYASSRDRALAASQLVHGYPRAGDSGDGLVVVAGIETIDVSNIDTTLLGHSYYSGNEPIIDDIFALLRESRAASMRPWLKSAKLGSGNYWVFDQKAATASVSQPPK